MSNRNFDPLESFIHNHRQEMDHATPPPALWEKIASQLPETPRSLSARKGFLVMHRWAAAATILLLLVAGIGIGIAVSNKQQNDMTADYEKKLNDIQQYYQQQVNQRLATLAKYQKKDAVSEDLSELDTFIQELRIELEHAPEQSHPIILNNLVRNYQAKINILEKVIEKTESAIKKEGHHEPNIQM